MDTAWEAASPRSGDFNLSGGRARVFAALLMALVALQNASVALIPVVAPSLQQRFAFSDAEIGLLTSVFALAIGLSAIPMGLATARWGGRVVILALGLYVAGTVIFAAGGSYGWFLTGRFIQGFGIGASVPAATALITRFVAPKARPAAFGLFGAGTGLGTTGSLLVMPSIARAWGYQGVFLAVAAFAACLALIGAMIPTVRGRPPLEGRAPTIGVLLRAVGGSARNPGVWLVVLLSLSPSGVVVGVLTWTPQFLHDSFGTALAVAAYVTAGIGVALMLGNPSGAFAMRRVGLGGSMTVGLAGMTVACALVPFSPGIALACLAVLATAVLAGTVMPPSLAAVAVVTTGPEALGAATGVIGLGNSAGAMVAPWIFGVLLDTYGTAPGESGYTAGYLVLAAYGVVGAVAALVFTLLKRAGRLGPRPRR